MPVTRRLTARWTGVIVTTRLAPLRAPLVASVARTLAVAVVLVAVVSGFAESALTRHQDPSALRLHQQEPEVRRAMAEHQCSTTGFGDTADPRSALIRRDGELLHVTFERAWSVFTGDRAGELVAVCLADR